METNRIDTSEMVDSVRELLEFIEENSICDIHNICWITNEDCYVDSERSAEMTELIQKIEETLGEDEI